MMENKCKRFLSLLLAFVMVLGMFPAGHAHAEGETVNVLSKPVTELQADAEYQLFYNGSRGVHGSVKTRDGFTGLDTGGNMSASDIAGNAGYIWTLKAADGGYRLYSAFAGKYAKLAGSTASLEDEANGSIFVFEYNAAAGTFKIKTKDGLYFNNLGGKNLMGGYGSDAVVFTIRKVLRDHTHNAVDIPAVAPTLNSTGLTAGQECADCGTVISGFESIPAKDYNDGIVPVEKIIATAGSYNTPTHENDGGPAYALDNDLNTKWHTNYSGNSGYGENTDANQWIDFGLDGTYDVTALRYKGRNGNGDITKYTIKVSYDGATYEDLIVDGVWTKDGLWKEVVFDDPLENVKNVRLQAVEHVGQYVVANEMRLVGEVHQFAEHEHTEVKIPAVEVTIGTDGKTEGKKCSECGEIILAQEVIPALYKSKAVPSGAFTATVGSYETSSATEGNANLALDDNFGTMWHTAWAGTARENLWFDFELTADYEVSGLYYKPRNGAHNGTITRYQVLGSYDGESWFELTSGDWDLNDSWKEAAFNTAKVKHVRLMAVESTCDQANKNVASAAEIRLVGVPCDHFHRYTVSVTDPTCTQNGTKTLTCTCGDTKTETIPAAHGTITHVAPKDATCTEAGYVEYWYCETCGETWADEACAQVIENVNIPALGHTFTVDGENDPTVEKCDRCDTLNPDYEPPVVELPDKDEVDFSGESEDETVDEEVKNDIIDAVQNNDAVNEYDPVEETDEADELKIVFTAATVVNDTPTKLVFDVTPMMDGEKVSTLSAPITFRLPVPNSVAQAFAKVFHDGVQMDGLFEVKDENGYKYVEITSANFSEYKVEFTDEIPVTYVAEINGEKYETLAAALTAAQSGDTVKLLADCESAGNIPDGATLDLNEHNIFLSQDPLAGRISLNGGAIVFADESGNIELIGPNSDEIKATNGILILSDTDTIFIDGTFTVVVSAIKATVAGTAKLVVESSEITDFNVSLDSTTASIEGPEDLNVTTTLDGYEVVYENGTYKLVEKIVARIGVQSYTTLAAALNAAQSGDTVKLLADCESAGNIPEGATLDLNGHKLYLTITSPIIPYGCIITNGGAIAMKLGENEQEIIGPNGTYKTDGGIIILSETGITMIAGTFTLDNNVSHVSITVKGTAKLVFNDCTIEEYNLILDSTTASIEGPEDLNVTTTQDGYEVVYENGTYTLAEKAPVTYVAMIGETGYATLAEAIAVGGEVTLLADVELTERLDISGTVSLKLNSHTISGDFVDAFGMIYVKKGAELNLVGNGSIIANKTHAIGNYGYVSVEGGNIVSNADETYAGLYNFYYQADYYGSADIFDGGSVDSVFNCGNLKVYGGHVAYVDNSGHLAVLLCEVNEIYARDGSDAPGVIGAGEIFIADPENINNITVPEGFKLVKIGKDTYQVVAKTYVAEINGIEYETLAAALSDAVSGDTVKLLADSEFEGTVPVGATLDLNSHKLIFNGIENLMGAGRISINGGTIVVKQGEEEIEMFGPNALMVKTNDGVLLMTGDGITMIEGTFNLDWPIGTMTVAGTAKLVVESSDTTFIYISLDSTTASIEGPEGLNVTTTQDGYEVVYENGTYTLVKKAPVAQIRDQKFTSLQAAFDAVQKDDIIELLEDIELDTYLTVDNPGKYCLDLHGHNITRVGGTAIYVNNNETILSIEAPFGGKVTGEQAIFAAAGTVKIYRGTFHGTGDAIYAYGTGHIEIYGGTFSAEGPAGTQNAYCVLNVHDGSRATASISVYGDYSPTFIGFNPADNMSEGAGTNFLAIPYYHCSRENNGKWTVFRSHDEVVDEAKAPTCTETGLTRGTHCSACGKVLVKQDVIPAKDHSWDILDYTNNGANHTVNYLCTNDASHTKSETEDHNFTNGDCACGEEAPVVSTTESGTWGGIDWTLTEDGVLTIAPTAGTPVADKNSGKTYEVGAWREAVRYNSKGEGLAIEGWPYDRSKVKTLIIKEGVTSIGSFTAQGYTNLTGEVVIPSTVKYIGQEAFQKSTFTKLTFAAGGTEELCIAQGAFKNLIIEEVSLPADRPVHLHAWVFNNCHNLKTAYIPASVVSVHGTNHIDYFKDFNAHSNPTWTKSSEIFAYNENMETIEFGNETVRDMFYANNNGTSLDYLVAYVGLTTYCDLTKAVAAANDGDTIVLLKDITEDVTVSKNLTIDGADKTFTGQMKLTNKADVTIKNVNFDGNGYNGYAVQVEGAYYITIEDCTAKNYGYGFLQVASDNVSLNVKNVAVSDCSYGIKVDYNYGVTLENVDLDCSVAGLLNSNYGEKTITIKDSDISILGTWTRNNTIKTTYTFEGANSIDEFITDAAIDNFKLAAGATLTAPQDITVTTDVEDHEVVYENGTYKLVEKKVAVAMIGEQGYETLAAAIAAAKAGDTITFVADITENVTINKSVTIDGAGKTYTGTMTGNKGLTITIENVNFVNGGFAKTTKSSNGTYTIKNCTFDGQGTYAYPVCIKGASKLVVEDCVVSNYLYSFLYVYSGTATVSVKNVTVENCPDYAVYFASGVNNATFENLTVKNSNRGFLINNTANRSFTIKDCKMENVGTAIEYTGGTKAITCTAQGNNDFGTAVLCEYAKVVLTENATLTAPEGLNVTTNVENHEVKYENGTYKVAEITVAKIGRVEYTTLQEAVDAAKAGQTITLLRSTEGAGVVINKNLTIDFAGHTYSLTVPVGSTGTESNGFQILAGNTVTLRNGTLKVADSAADKFYILIQNYADLKLNSITLDGRNLDKYAFTDGDSYVLSNNSGNSSAIATKIIVNDNGDKAVAFDVCKFGNYTEPTMNIKVADAIYVDETTLAVDYAKYVEAAAFRGNNHYATLQQAVDLGGTVTLFKDIAGSGVVIRNDVNINFANHTYTITEPVGSTGTESNGFQILKGTDVVFRNGTLKVADSAANKFYILVQNYSDSLSMSSMTLDGTNLDKYAFTDGDSYTLSNNSGNVNIGTGTKIIANNDGALAFAFDACDQTDKGYDLPVVTVHTRATIEGNIEAAAKIGNVYYATLQQAIDAAGNGKTITLMSNIKVDADDVVRNSDNRIVMFEIEGKSLTLDMNGKTIDVAYDSNEAMFAVFHIADGASLTVKGNGKVNLTTGDTKAGKYDCVYYMFWKQGTTGTLNIEDGTFTANKVEDSMVYTNGNRIVTVKGGTWTLQNVGTKDNQAPWIFNTAGQNERTILVSGGTYNFNVAKQYYACEVSIVDANGNLSYVVDNGNGTWTVTGKTAEVGIVTPTWRANYLQGYATFKDAVASIAKGAAETTIVLQKDITVKGQFIGHSYAQKVVIDLNGYKMSSTDKTLTVYRGGTEVTIKNGTVNGNTTGGTIQVTYGGKLTLGENVTIKSGGSATALKVDANSTLIVDQDTTYVLGGKNDLVVANGATVQISAGYFKKPVQQAWCAEGYVPTDKLENGYYSVMEDPANGMAAVINGTYYATLQEAIAAAATGDTITVLADIAVDTSAVVANSSGYAAIYNIAEKAITIDLNGKKIEATVNAADLESYQDGILLGVFCMDTNGKLTLTGEGTVTANLVDAPEAPTASKLYSLMTAYGTDSELVVENGTFHANSVNSALIYSQYDEIVTINGGTYTLGNLGKGSNGSPWLFNAKGQNTRNILVNGGTFSADIQHQYYPFEVLMPKELALKKADGMFTVVPAVAYVNEQEWSSAWYTNYVGYATVEEAEAAAEGIKTKVVGKKTYYSDCEVVTLLVKGGENLEDVLNGEAENVALPAGEYTLPSTSGDVSITGTKDTVITVNDVTAQQISMSGVTVKSSGAAYTGIKHSEEVVFNDCTIVGNMYLYAENVVFTNCTFDLSETNDYIWVYGAKNVTFKDCTFNTMGKAILVFQDGSKLDQTVTVEGCTFNASQGAYTWDGIHVAAVSMDGRQGGTYNVILNNNTVDSNFSDLWQDKTSAGNITVIVDGTTELTKN